MRKRRQQQVRRRQQQRRFFFLLRRFVVRGSVVVTILFLIISYYYDSRLLLLSYQEENDTTLSYYYVGELTVNKLLPSIIINNNNNNNNETKTSSSDYSLSSSPKSVPGIITANTIATTNNSNNHNNNNNSDIQSSSSSPAAAAATTSTTKSSSNTTNLILFADTYGRIVHVDDEDEDNNKQQQKLVVYANETHFFWKKKAQLKLCRILRQMTNTKVNEELGKQQQQSSSSSSTTSLPTIKVLQMTVNCTELSYDEAYGQGNWITAFYMSRMATILAKVDFIFKCSEDSTTIDYDNQLLPWLQGYYQHSFIPPRPKSEEEESSSTPEASSSVWPGNNNNNNNNNSSNIPTTKEVCTNKYERIRIDKMIYHIRYDMRKLATKVLEYYNNTKQHQKKKNLQLSQSQSSPRNILDDIDDIAIHFRCGDVLGGQKRNDFGMIKFSEYRKWIDLLRNNNNNMTTSTSTNTSIGIITQPFELNRNRRIDSIRSNSCKIVVHKLVEYLSQYYYPNNQVKITIRNTLEETLPIAYTRLILAKRQSFCSLSSFGIFPIIGTYGNGYYQKGNTGVNPWTKYITLPNYQLSNLHEMNAPVLGTYDIYNMITNQGLQPVLDWFVAEDGY